MPAYLENDTLETQNYHGYHGSLTISNYILVETVSLPVTLHVCTYRLSYSNQRVLSDQTR